MQNILKKWLKKKMRMLESLWNIKINGAEQLFYWIFKSQCNNVLLFCFACTQALISFFVFLSSPMFFKQARESFGFCYFQASIFQLFCPMGCLYTTCLSLNMLMMCKGMSKEKIAKTEKYCHAACIGLPIIFSIFALFTVEVSTSEQWCWIPIVHQSEVLLSFYIPIFIIFVINAVIVGYITHKIRNDFFSGNENLNLLVTSKMKLKLKNNLKRIILYPVVFVIFYSFAFIDRVEIIATRSEDIFGLTMLHNLVLLEGFCSAMILGFTPSVSRKVTQKFSKEQLQDGVSWRHY